MHAHINCAHLHGKGVTVGISVLISSLFIERALPAYYRADGLATYFRLLPSQPCRSLILLSLGYIQIFNYLFFYLLYSGKPGDVTAAKCAQNLTYY